MDDKERRDEIALFRYRMIAEIVAEPSANARQRLIAAIARRQHDIPYSDRTTVGRRTLQRWITTYLDQGLKGLEPVQRLDAGRERALNADVLAAAVALRREKPACSVRQMR